MKVLIIATVIVLTKELFRLRGGGNEDNLLE